MSPRPSTIIHRLFSLTQKAQKTQKTLVALALPPEWLLYQPQITRITQIIMHAQCTRIL